MEPDELRLKKPKVPRSGGRVVQTVVLDNRRFEQTYIRCSREGCERCAVGGKRYDPDRPGHGPYWYRLIRNKSGRLIRKYVGKELTSDN